MSFDEQTIRQLLDLRDDIGVLSFYVGITPARAAEPTPGWPIEIRNQIRDLRKRLKDDGPREHWEAVDARLDALGDKIDRLSDPSRHGRGRALFATVAGETTHDLSVQIPFRDRVVFDRNAYVRPLVAAHDEGRPAGVAVVHKGGVRLLEWHLGTAEELTNDEFTIGGRDWRKASGPAPAQPLDSRVGGQKRDQFEDRVDQNRLRFVRDQARAVADVANSRGWDRLIVAGDPRLTEPFAEQLHPTGGEQLRVADLSWENEAPNVIAEQAWDTFKTLRQARLLNLVADARDRALSGGAGALGLEEVLGSLNEGRVERLLFDVDVNPAGYVTDDGMLFTENGKRAMNDDAAEEPLLIERMIDRVVETSAAAVPVDGEAAEELAEHGGVAAILRW